VIERKTFSGELKAASGDGQLVATFSRFGVVDRDGDVTLASAIPDGTELLLGAWNHSSVTGSTLPIGKGYVANDGSSAKFVGSIFDTDDALAEFAVIRGLGSLAQYSYSFRVISQSTDYKDLEAYPGSRRILKEIEPFEVSAVYSGAGIGTGTDRAKGIAFGELGIGPALLATIRGAGLVNVAELGFTAAPGTRDSSLIDLRTL